MDRVFVGWFVPADPLAIQHLFGCNVALDDVFPEPTPAAKYVEPRKVVSNLLLAAVVLREG